MSAVVCKRHFWWRHIWRHLHVTILKCWEKFSNVLIRRSIEMIRAKNYKTVAKFVKIMPRILWSLFFPDTVYMETDCSVLLIMLCRPAPILCIAAAVLFLRRHADWHGNIAHVLLCKATFTVTTVRVLVPVRVIRMSEARTRRAFTVTHTSTNPVAIKYLVKIVKYLEFLAKNRADTCIVAKR